MSEKRVSRGRGPKIREEEIDRMVALYSEGKSFMAIGKAVGRHWQSVKKYTLKALQERPGQELRREALKEALIAHFQDLFNALAVIIQMVQLPDDNNWENIDWLPPTLDRRNRLLLDALRESHVKDSPLWDWWDSWNQDRKHYQEALGDLHDKLSQEVQEIEEKYSGSGIVTTEYLIQMLFKRSISVIRGAAIYDASMLKIKTGVDQGDGKKEDELWLGQSTRLVAGTKDIEGFKDELSNLMQDMDEWAEVKALQKHFEKMAEIKDKIEEEIEVLSLRRAFPGRCRLCPV